MKREMGKKKKTSWITPARLCFIYLFIYLGLDRSHSLLLLAVVVLLDSLLGLLECLLKVLVVLALGNIQELKGGVDGLGLEGHGAVRSEQALAQQQHLAVDTVHLLRQCALEARGHLAHNTEALGNLAQIGRCAHHLFGLVDGLDWRSAGGGSRGGDGGSDGHGSRGGGGSDRSLLGSTSGRHFF